MESKAIDTLNAHFKQWQEIANRIRVQVSPVLKQQEALQKSFQQIILDEQARWKKLVESIQMPPLPDFSLLIKPAIEFQKSIQGLISPALEQLQRSFRELPSRTQEAILLLGAYGWYFDLEMSLPDLWKLKKSLSEGNIAEAEDSLIEYFESRIDEIEESISKIFPHRQKLICKSQPLAGQSVPLRS